MNKEATYYQTLRMTIGQRVYVASLLEEFLKSKGK